MRSPRFGKSAGLALFLFVILVTVALGVSRRNNAILTQDMNTEASSGSISIAFNQGFTPDAPATPRGAWDAVRDGERANSPSDEPAGEVRDGSDTVEEETSGKDGDDTLGVGGPLGTERPWVAGSNFERSNAARAATAEPSRPDPITDYVVQPGDSVWTIARAHGVDVDTVAAANGLVHADRILPGEKLIVPVERGVVHEVGEGEALSSIAQRYDVDMRGIIEVNGIRDADRLRVGQVLLVPGATPRPPGDLVVWHGELQPVFHRPVRGGWISSRFGMRWGRMHEGIDIAVVAGTPVRASAPGVVSFSGWNGGYGRLIVIDHGSGVETRYGHNSRLIARAGQRVQTGQIISYSGNTGNSTGPHVHFEIRWHGRAVNVFKYLYD